MENARADVGFVGLILEDFKNKEFDICEQQRDLYGNKLQTSYDFRTGQPQPFKYRVWGKIYNCDNCPVFIRVYFNINYLNSTILYNKPFSEII